MDESRHGDHRDLLVWQKAMVLATDLHRATVDFPRSETFGLTSQMRRASVSIPANLAEGSARRTTRDFMAYVHVARGSLVELDTLLQLAHGFGYLPDRSFDALTAQCGEIGRMLTALLHALRRRDARPLPPPDL
jgi:four helix bundle protein